MLYWYHKVRVRVRSTDEKFRYHVRCGFCGDRDERRMVLGWNPIVTLSGRYSAYYSNGEVVLIRGGDATQL